MSNEKPILFKDDMIRAILEGRKTQTRRIVKSPAKNMQASGAEVIKHRAPGDKWYGDHVWSMRGSSGVWGDYTHERFLSMCPYGKPGDRLWVRETFSASEFMGCRYRADGQQFLNVNGKDTNTPCARTKGFGRRCGISGRS